MFRLTKSLDSKRVALSNDGWEHTQSDLCTIHDYRDAEALRRRVRQSIRSSRRLPQRGPFMRMGIPIAANHYLSQSSEASSSLKTCKVSATALQPLSMT